MKLLNYCTLHVSTWLIPGKFENRFLAYRRDFLELLNESHVHMQMYPVYMSLQLKPCRNAIPFLRTEKNNFPVLTETWKDIFIFPRFKELSFPQRSAFLHTNTRLTCL